jgi:hypothetical protein
VVFAMKNALQKSIVICNQMLTKNNHLPVRLPESFWDTPSAVKMGFNALPAGVSL